MKADTYGHLQGRNACSTTIVDIGLARPCKNRSVRAFSGDRRGRRRQCAAGAVPLCGACRRRWRLTRCASLPRDCKEASGAPWLAGRRDSRLMATRFLGADRSTDWAARAKRSGLAKSLGTDLHYENERARLGGSGSARRVCGGGGGNRTRVRKPYTVRTTCLAWLFELRLARANRQARARLAASTDPAGQAVRPAGEADVNDAAPSFEGLAHQQASAASRGY
jgi:hypothetical protein